MLTFRRVRTVTRGLGATVTGTVGTVVRSVEEGVLDAEEGEALVPGSGPGRHTAPFGSECFNNSLMGELCPYTRPGSSGRRRTAWSRRLEVRVWVDPCFLTDRRIGALLLSSLSPE